ncbi:hypothetical protein LSH36_660g00007 [Paralvinella palmiformis]|uniref:G-protein coupled receptors family 1 profile domain-containing protein n=1 Tax=Paralvinella palmiformis TaxID=53620 RepID=A0AAD9J3L1_9ANNE|nr:hypothetical protein LSH36_660g00007 [Paralvinella palmiformis]
MDQWSADDQFESANIWSTDSILDVDGNATAPSSASSSSPTMTMMTTMTNVSVTRPSGPSPTAITISTFLAFICVVGLVGNGLVVFVVSRYTKMKTVTNMYILNLSVADFFYLLGLPLVMVVSLRNEWVFGAAMCRIYYMLTCVNWFTGTFTLVMMSADRFLAVCYPIASMRYRTPIYAIAAIALIWIVSFVAMLPIVLFAGLVQHPGTAESYTCNINWPSDDQMTGYRIFILYDFLIGFLIPVGLISVFYALLLCRLRATGSQIRNADRRRSHRKVTKLVTLIIAVFIICWLPFWSFQVYNVFRRPGALANWKLFLNYIFSMMSYTNSMVNPLLYAFTNDNFRESFISAFRCAADPILGPGARRWSEYVSAGNNNSLAQTNSGHQSRDRNKTAGGRAAGGGAAGGADPAATDHGQDYEFTMLTSNSNSPAGNSTKQEADVPGPDDERQKLTADGATGDDDVDGGGATDVLIGGGVYTGPNTVNT